jgi:hypothetical protein
LATFWSPRSGKLFTKKQETSAAVEIFFENAVFKLKMLRNLQFLMKIWAFCEKKGLF